MIEGITDIRAGKLDAARAILDHQRQISEPMTPAQRSYLNTLAQDTGETVDENLTKAEASKKIDELRKESPRLAGRELD